MGPSDEPMAAVPEVLPEPLRRALALDDLRGFVDDRDVSAPSVSTWSVGAQIEHCALAATGIGKALIVSEGAPPRQRPTWPRLLVLGLGHIPRGRARAPEKVIPTPSPSAEALHAALDETEQVLTRAAALGPRVWFEHFALGVMARDQALRFVGVHHRHHLAIIRDILRAARRATP